MPWTLSRRKKTWEEREYRGQSLAGPVQLDMESPGGSATFGSLADAPKIKPERSYKRRFSLQSPATAAAAAAAAAGFFAKVGNRVKTSGFSASRSRSGSQSNLKVDSTVGHRKDSVVEVHPSRRQHLRATSSEEELNRQFEDFDSYLGDVEEVRASGPRLLPAPPVVRITTVPDKRPRSYSETRPLGQHNLSRLLKLTVRRSSRADPSAAEWGEQEQPHLPCRSPVGEACGSTLQLLPENVQVHHSTPVWTPTSTLSPASSDQEIDDRRPSLVSFAHDDAPVRRHPQRGRAFSVSQPSADHDSAFDPPRGRSISFSTKNLLAVPTPPAVVADASDGSSRRRRMSLGQLLLAPMRRGRYSRRSTCAFVVLL